MDGVTLARPSWDAYFLHMAQAVSSRADCRRARHGAVIVNPDRRVVGTGYNGSVPGGPSCLAGECPRGLKSTAERKHFDPDYSDCISLHAEMNAIAHAYGDTKGGTIYVTGPPCDMCSKLIAAAGIVRTIYPGEGGAVQGDGEEVRDGTNHLIATDVEHRPERLPFMRVKDLLHALVDLPPCYGDHPTRDAVVQFTLDDEEFYGITTIEDLGEGGIVARLEPLWSY